MVVFMPRGFNEKEKQEIASKLLASGRERWIRHGFKKTSVDEIARDAGISKGAFYKFFNSKEEFFFDILEELESGVRLELMSRLSQPGKKGREGFGDFIASLFLLMASEPASTMLDPEVVGDIRRHVPAKRIERHEAGDQEFAREFMKKLKKRFEVPNPECIPELFRMLFYLALLRRTAAEKEFDSMKELWTKMAVEYCYRLKKD